MYYDLLAKIKNAELAKKKTLTAPFSKMDSAVLEALVGGGYLGGVQKKSSGRKNFLEAKLRGAKDSPIEFRIISRPSRRVYRNWRNIKSVKHGYGLAVISTPKGVMSDKEARKNKVGGEYLFEVW